MGCESKLICVALKYNVSENINVIEKMGIITSNLASSGFKGGTQVLRIMSSHTFIHLVSKILYKVTEFAQNRGHIWRSIVKNRITTFCLAIFSIRNFS